ncbi:MAG: type II toxin-antitoxin system HicB family antitoxin [Victivallales bacterium]|nr:type II toxin-antitoxin system HicB family antitoxin [Victivallales bacterium]
MEKRTYCMFVYDGGSGDGGLCCEFPDIPGCMTDGDNLEDLMKNAVDVLETMMEVMIEDGQTLPTPSDAATLKKKADASEEPVLLTVPVTGYLHDEPARINITSTTSKIAEITAFAKRIKRTRSELMVNATLDYIHANA